MILIVLIRIRKYFVLLWNKNKILIMLPMISAIHSKNYISFGQKTFSDSIPESNYKRYGMLLHKVSIK